MRGAGVVPYESRGCVVYGEHASFARRRVCLYVAEGLATRYGVVCYWHKPGDAGQTSARCRDYCVPAIRNGLPLYVASSLP